MDRSNKSLAASDTGAKPQTDRFGLYQQFQPGWQVQNPVPYYFAAIEPDPATVDQPIPVTATPIVPTESEPGTPLACKGPIKVACRRGEIRVSTLVILVLVLLALGTGGCTAIRWIKDMIQQNQIFVDGSDVRNGIARG